MNFENKSWTNSYILLTRITWPNDISLFMKDTEKNIQRSLI